MKTTYSHIFFSSQFFYLINLWKNLTSEDISRSIWLKFKLRSSIPHWNICYLIARINENSIWSLVANFRKYNCLIWFGVICFYFGLIDTIKPKTWNAKVKKKKMKKKERNFRRKYFFSQKIFFFTQKYFFVKNILFRKF